MRIKPTSSYKITLVIRGVSDRRLLGRVAHKNKCKRDGGQRPADNTARRRLTASEDFGGVTFPLPSYRSSIWTGQTLLNVKRTAISLHGQAHHCESTFQMLAGRRGPRQFRRQPFGGLRRPLSIASLGDID